MADPTPSGQSGGIYNVGSMSAGGSIVGRDMITGAPPPPSPELLAALRPLAEAVRAAPPEAQAKAEINLTAITNEAAKGKDAKDGEMAKLLDGLVGLVPSAASAVVSAFATPILGGLVGPVTTFVLDKLRGA